jgi:hypothetical protein
MEEKGRAQPPPVRARYATTVAPFFVKTKDCRAISGSAAVGS